MELVGRDGTIVIFGSARARARWRALQLTPCHVRTPTVEPADHDRVGC